MPYFFWLSRFYSLSRPPKPLKSVCRLQSRGGWAKIKIKGTKNSIENWWIVMFECTNVRRVFIFPSHRWSKSHETAKHLRRNNDEEELCLFFEVYFFADCKFFSEILLAWFRRKEDKKSRLLIKKNILKICNLFFCALFFHFSLRFVFIACLNIYLARFPFFQIDCYSFFYESRSWRLAEDFLRLTNVSRETRWKLVDGAKNRSLKLNTKYSSASKKDFFYVSILKNTQKRFFSLSKSLFFLSPLMFVLNKS